VELRKALAEKDAELAKVRAELEVERRTRTNAAQLREELREAQADVKALRRRNGVLKGDVGGIRNAECGDEEKQGVVEPYPNPSVGRRGTTTLDNGKLTQALEKRRAAMDKLAQELDAAVRHH
jgi:predicted nuclease with TOPRIM domain